MLLIWSNASKSRHFGIREGSEPNAALITPPISTLAPDDKRIARKAALVAVC